MTYTPDLEESNAALRRRQDANPVIPNAAAPERSADYTSEFNTSKPVSAPAAADPMEAFYSSGVGVDFGGDTVPDGSRPAVSTQPQAAAPAAPPRPAVNPVAESAMKRRVIEGGVSVPVTQRPLTTETGYPATDQNLIQDSLFSRQRAQERTIAAAGEEANVREGTAGMRADAARAQAGQDLLRAESEARVARFRAANGADVILGSSRRSKDRAAATLGAQADAAERKVGIISGRANAADPAGRDVLGDAIATADASNKGMSATLAGQASVVGSAVQKAKLEEQQRVNQLGAAVAGAKTPQERAAATKSLLALLGKDPRKTFQALPISLQGSVDPNTGTAIKGGEAVVIIGEDGSHEIIKLGDQGQSKQAGVGPDGKPLATGQMRQDKNGLKQRWDGSKWVNV